MKHVIIKDDTLNGYEYGCLNSFEKAIVAKTGAEYFFIPGHQYPDKFLKHFGHGMKRGQYRHLFPKKQVSVKADVGWCILMSPENYRLDLYAGWDKEIGIKVLYLFDTLPAQYPLIKKLLSNNKWDILITSFNDAVADLQTLTGRKWHCVEQAADNDLFKPVPFNERLIHFSAYGRRNPLVHDSLIEFCKVKGLYYDYTTVDGKFPLAGSDELYRQYAWHMAHSLFTFSWPVEMTNPARAGHLHPITCRWFEAATAGTVILGKKPGNNLFDEQLCQNLVTAIDPENDKDHLFRELETIWDNRQSLHEQAIRSVKEHAGKWTWDARVSRIIDELINPYPAAK